MKMARDFRHDTESEPNMRASSPVTHLDETKHKRVTVEEYAADYEFRGESGDYSPTAKAKEFMKANDRSKVVSGAAHEEGGGTYTLNSGRSFKLTLEDARSLPEGYPDWGFRDGVKK